MYHITFKNLQSLEETTVEAHDGQTIMEIAIENSIEGIVAECGGACSCATCHIYVDSPWLNLLPEMDLMEEDMLEFALNLKNNSRLSCQIVFKDKLDGMVVYIPAQ